MLLQSLVRTTESLLEIDHIVICVSAPIPASALADLGLVSPSQPLCRSQQGTASRLIFFENAYLELIWVEDETAAEIYAMQSGIDFLARANWQQTQASPFSIALRPKPEPHRLNSTFTDDSQPLINFSADNWRAQVEPLCFMIPESVSLISLLDSTSVTHQQLLSHTAQIQQLTSASIALNARTKLTDSITLLDREGVVSIELQSEPLLNLTFDHRIQKQMLDLRELGIPAVLNY